MSRTFLDTNVCVYIFDESDPGKQRVAQTLYDSKASAYVISTQVLQECFNVLTRGLSQPLSADIAEAHLGLLCEFHVVSSDAALVLRAVRTVREHQLFIWDALIVEAAVRGGCDVLLTEDLNAGQVIRGVEIVNPFA